MCVRRRVGEVVSQPMSVDLTRTLDRGIEAELCCLLDEGVPEFDGELRVRLEVGEEDVRRGGELVVGPSTLGVWSCCVEVREVVVECIES